jgi:hypothetical protein
MREKESMRVIYCATEQDGQIRVHKLWPSTKHKGRWSDGTKHAIRIVQKERFQPSPEEAVRALLESQRHKARELEEKFAAERGELERVIRIASEWLDEKMGEPL